MTAPETSPALRTRTAAAFRDAARQGELSGIRVGTSIAISIAAVAIQEPRGATGIGLLSMLLVIADLLLLLSRHIPDQLVPPGIREVLLYVSVAAAAATIAVSTGGLSVVFGFYAAGHAGYRLRPERSIPVAVVCSIACTLATVLPVHGHGFFPWYVTAATGLSVLLGMVNRSRRDAFTSAVAAAESAERAARAEARETVLAERGRIARDVHDVLAHSLAGINMQLEMADALMDAGRTDQAREATRRAQSLVRESLAEAQRTVRALREDALPLVETVRAMAETSGCEPELVGEVREIDTRIAQALIRIAQESLTNAHKHAPDAALTVRVTYAPDHVSLEVRNAAPAQTDKPLTNTGSGMGLVGMRERIALVGGHVEAGPVTDGPDAGGWRVHAEAPTP